MQNPACFPGSAPFPDGYSRLLFYSVQLCQIDAGEEYGEILPLINIGLLDFTLFPDNPEFYSRNLLMNTKNHKIYSDKFDIRVLDSTCIHLATEEDKKYHIDDWARLFKATTWEDIRMVAQNNTHLGEAAQTLYKMNADEMVRLKCLARLDYEREQARYEYTLKKIRKWKLKSLTLLLLTLILPLK